MKKKIEPNGDLTLLLEYDEAEDFEKRDWSYILEESGFAPNSVLCLVDPEDIGALTSAPIFTDYAEWKDDGTCLVKGNVWWFPDYCLEDPVDTLCRHGQVTLTAAPLSENKN